MPLKKELFEYVKLDDADIVKDDLEKTSRAFTCAIDEVQTMLELHKEKHELIRDARAQTKEFLSELKFVNDALLKKIFKECIGKRAVKRPLPKIKLRAEYEPEKLAISSKQALKCLQKNLAELKKELRVE